MAKIKFNSWQREGIGNAIQNASTLGRPKIELGVTINNELPEKKQFQVLGPGDLLGFSKDLVIRTEPVDWNTNFPPNLLAHIEFYDEDFPWRYSPEAATAGQTRLDPWLALIVLKEDEFKLGAQMVPLPFIELFTTAKLPPLSENHLWAHVQEMPADNAKNPDRIISRLLCPRKLEPNTPYHAFVVPSYENGRRAGLGQEEANVNAPATAPSWDVTNLGGWKLPIYYQWYFHTGNNVDFEYFGSLLEPRDLDPMVGRKKLDCGKPGFGITDYATPFNLYLEGALKAANTAPSLDNTSATNRTAFAAAMPNILKPPVAVGADPELAPPFYGQKHIAEPSLDPVKSTWIHQLNRDPAQRAPAGLGVQVLRKCQDHYMQKAWEQVDSIAKANKIIETAAGTLAVSQALYDKHFNLLMTSSYSATDKFYTGMALLAPVHVKVKGGNIDSGAHKTKGTLQHLLEHNDQNTSMYGTAFRRATRKRGAFYKKLGRNGTAVDFSKLVLQPKENDLPEAKPMDGLFLDMPTVNPPKFDAAAIDAFNKMIQPPPSSSNTNRLSFKESIEPRHTFPSVLNNMLEMPPGFGSFTDQDSIKPALAYPDFEDPMYLKLIELSPEYLIPNLHLIPNNTVALLESNQAFIESFMVGLNVEICREMRWREYPTDERGSCFRQFWDMRGLKNRTGLSDAHKSEAFKDITPIHTWKKPKYDDAKNTLGAHNNRPAKAGANQLVLALRGDLFKCFPDASVYMMKARQEKEKTKFELDPAGEVKFPAFKAEVGADVKLLGFDLSLAEAKGNATAASPGWFFVIQETPGETRFGMDIDAPSNPSTWDDISWTMFKGMEFITEVQTVYNPLPKPSDDAKKHPKWGQSSADMASILYQKPVMIAIHADEMLDGLQ